MNNNNTFEKIIEYLYISEHIFYHRYNDEGVLEYTNSSISLFNDFFIKTNVLDYLANNQHNYNIPMVIYNRVDFIWCAIFEHDTSLKNIHVFGPYVSKDLSVNEILKEVDINNKLTEKFSQKLRKYLIEIPNIQVSTFYQQIILINYLFNNVVLKTSDFVIKNEQDNKTNEEKIKAKDSPIKLDDAISYYNIEKKVLSNIENGNLNYQDDYNQYEDVIRTSGSMKYVNFKSQIVFISLCTRQAIAGGVSIDKAYEIGNKYTQLLSSSSAETKNRDLLRDMYSSFIHLVNDKSNKSYSKVISSTIDYISSNVENDINISILAKRVGYTDYYLSRKFKKEVGTSINNYINVEKINRAKLLLETTDNTITNIANILCYESRSNFVNVFKGIVGSSPKEYRITRKRF